MDKFEKILDVIDHQDKYSDEEIREILQDEECRKLYQTMQEVDSALLDGDLKEKASEMDIDKEWLKFDKAHPDKSSAAFSWQKVAASVVGLVLVSGFAFAAIHSLVSMHHDAGRASSEGTNKEIVLNDSTQQEVPGDSLLKNKTAKPAVRKTFENVTFDKMVSEIAAYYDMQVRFDNAETQRLRVYYDWDSRSGIGNTVKELNQFENVNIKVERQTVVIK
jgi:ferric-dicitrate binding protein FerR (iron transport regulator)